MYTSTTKNNIFVIDWRDVYLRLHLFYDKTHLFEINVKNISNIEKTNNGTLISIHDSITKYEVTEDYNDVLETVNFYKRELDLPQSELHPLK